MKKWMYLIFPGIMLGGLFFVYVGHVEKAEKKAKDVAARIAKEKSDAEEKKRTAEGKAREDAKKRQDDRDAEEKAKADKKTAQQAADDKKVADQIAEFTTKADATQKQLSGLDAELARLRKEKDTMSRETFDLAKQVELARVARRNAELEVQRMTEMISRRASESSMTRPPALPPPPPPKK